MKLQTDVAELGSSEKLPHVQATGIPKGVLSMWPGLALALVAGGSTSKHLRSTRWKRLPFVTSFKVTHQREGTGPPLPPLDGGPSSL